MNRTRALAFAALLAAPAAPATAQSADDLALAVARGTEAVMPKVVAWRRDLHQHPELSNREFRTAKLVAEHLRGLGLEVQTGVAHTGVVGILRGGRPGPVVALRADMDALPVAEEVDLPFASRQTAEYNGQTVGVMHACGHDTHVAMLMGAAEVLAGMRDALPGTVKFVFQPAEEGAPAGEEGGAAMMVREGVLQNPDADAIFGLHVFPFPVGEIHYRAGGLMASVDRFTVVVRGKQTHGALPWDGIDPVVVAAQVINAIQTIPSRQMKLTEAPLVVTVGRVSGGIRYNIIPDSVVLEGTIRAFDEAMRSEIHARLRRTAELTAQASGATASVEIVGATDVTHNDPALVARMLPTLRRVGGDRVREAQVTTTGEDFAFFQKRIPGMLFFLGVTPPGTTPVPNHSPRFVADEAALPIGVRAMSMLAVDYLAGGK